MTYILYKGIRVFRMYRERATDVFAFIHTINTHKKSRAANCHVTSVTRRQRHHVPSRATTGMRQTLAESVLMFRGAASKVPRRNTLVYSGGIRFSVFLTENGGLGRPVFWPLLAGRLSLCREGEAGASACRHIRIKTLLLT